MTKPGATQNEIRYDEGGQRVTSCCGAYSTFSDADLVCKVCYHIVPDGEGDGTEYREGVTADSYWEAKAQIAGRAS